AQGGGAVGQDGPSTQTGLTMACRRRSKEPRVEPGVSTGSALGSYALPRPNSPCGSRNRPGPVTTTSMLPFARGQAKRGLVSGEVVVSGCRWDGRPHVEPGPASGTRGSPRVLACRAIALTVRARSGVS